ncbi:DUF6732 family protein [Roseibium sp.]|uniref:DUF6732 family protein n=1 Tax=Roseibium sp. TaxID=1936156 RepID=UPI003A977871
MSINAGSKSAAVCMALLAIGVPSAAMAHAGHLGELAGHSHWIGVAALAGAALVAGIAALKGKREAEGEESTDAVAEGEADAEAAR